MLPRCLVSLFTLLGCLPASAAEPIHFSRDIQPILAENCYFCHGPDAKKRKADLRLDTKEGALGVLKLGDSAASELVRRITSTKPHQQMPPPKSNRTLTPEQVTLLKRWIDAGAPWGDHWAFTPLERPRPPQADQSLHPIDRFVAARQRRAGLAFAPEAERTTLLRRVTLDLTGLPPTPEEVAAFVSDLAPDAYAKVVDRLLGSPAYGERMAWDWLDAARYADSNGYQGDGDRTMWPWRDWVVEAFNRNLPYDQFTIWQLAGDLLPAATFEQKLATGFCRNHMINGEGGRIAEENRVDYVMDMTETMGTVWLGLTLNCCRCHDHKYDALSQKDYYGLFAFFNQTPVTGGGGDPQTAPNLEIPTSAAEPADPKAARRVRVMVMEDMPKPRKTFLLGRGQYNKPGVEVAAAVPAKLPPLPAGLPANRLGLARWLVAAENPLTARVTVNRLWQQCFGVGLVKTVEDFGVQGEIPLHGELLDWLAREFRDSGWDLKALLRLIVTSQTYRQSSRVTPLLAERDPENRLLARGPRFRLPAWMLRDQALAASGLLARRSGGPAVRGYQPPGVWEEATFGNKRYQQDHGEALYRRSLYTFWRRILGPTLFFDNASRQICTVKPFRTNTPLHALAMLNDATYVEAARVLAERALLINEATHAERLNFLYRRVLARPATVQEQTILLAGYQRARSQFATDLTAAGKLLTVGESPRDLRFDPVQHAAWTTVCLSILNLDETLTKE